MDLMLSSVLITPGRVPEHPRSTCSDCEDPASLRKPSEQPAVLTALSGSGGLAVQGQDEATYDSAVRRRLGAPSVSVADEAMATGGTDQTRGEARPVDGDTAAGGADDGAEPVDDEATEADSEAAAADLARPTSASGEPLSDEEVRQVQALEARDKEVRAHEQAHKAVGGAYAGSIHYDYQRGPDDKRYAVGGHVSIDMSEVPGNPAATMQKMQTVRRAALAPAEPSAADRAVAADASQKEAEARRALREERAVEAKEATDTTGREDVGAEPSSAVGAPSVRPVDEASPMPSGADGSVDRATLAATIERAAAAAPISSIRSIGTFGIDGSAPHSRRPRLEASIRRAYGAMG